MKPLLRLLNGMTRLPVMPIDSGASDLPAAPPLASLPPERIGVSGQVMAKVELPTDFDVSQGRLLRMREVTIAPGGFLPMHSHADRPAVAYVLQGTMTEYVEGEEHPVVVTAGQAYSTHRRPHALLNRGDIPVVFLEIDLF